MGQQEHNKEVDPALRDLYPNLSEEELKKAQENLEKYLELAIRIYERIKRENETDNDSDL